MTHFSLYQNRNLRNVWYKYPSSVMHVYCHITTYFSDEINLTYNISSDIYIWAKPFWSIVKYIMHFTTKILKYDRVKKWLLCGIKLVKIIGLLWPIVYIVAILITGNVQGKCTNQNKIILAKINHNACLFVYLFNVYVLYMSQVLL